MEFGKNSLAHLALIMQYHFFSIFKQDMGSAITGGSQIKQ